MSISQHESLKTVFTAKFSYWKNFCGDKLCNVCNSAGYCDQWASAAKLKFCQVCGFSKQPIRPNLPTFLFDDTISKRCVRSEQLGPAASHLQSTHLLFRKSWETGGAVCSPIVECAEAQGWQSRLLSATIIQECKSFSCRFLVCRSESLYEQVCVCALPPTQSKITTLRLHSGTIERRNLRSSGKVEGEKNGCQKNTALYWESWFSLLTSKSRLFESACFANFPSINGVRHRRHNHLFLWCNWTSSILNGPAKTSPVICVFKIIAI